MQIFTIKINVSDEKIILWVNKQKNRKLKKVRYRILLFDYESGAIVTLWFMGFKLFFVFFLLNKKESS